MINRTDKVASGERVMAWDAPTRLFHWLLVLSIVSAWASYEFAEQLGDATMKWHRYNGYAVLVLIVFRLIWGFVGSSTSRWSSFVRGPAAAVRYGLDVASGRERRFLGHNPLGTYMVLALLAAVAIQAMLGLVVTEHNDTTWGPLYNLVPESLQGKVRRWHSSGLYWVILPLVVAHIAANALYGVLKRDPLIPAMITGRKPAADYEDGHAARIAPATTARALAALLGAIAIVLGGIKLLGGTLFY